MDLTECRKNIDRIDDEILKLFLERMNIAASVAEYKQKNNMQTLQKSRERDILQRMSQNAGEEMEDYARILFQTLMDLSKSYQNKKIGETHGVLKEKIKNALDVTPSLFPQNAVVACQGIEGAYSQIACDKLFKSANILYVKNFEGVFSAVEKGLCRYGILPIENSIHGTVNAVYDLMRNYNFSIAKCIKLKISHALLAKKGTKLSEINEIISHEQALGQCSEFLNKYPDIKITVCENTAIAAKIVCDSERCDIAAISSPDCAGYYGLMVLDDAIANSDNNYTRFICISKNLEIYPGADKVSIIMNIPHTPGSLYSIISKFAAAGLNLTKLESRPIPGKDFEFAFYFELDASVYSGDAIKVLDELASGDGKLAFLGCYSQI